MNTPVHEMRTNYTALSYVALGLGGKAFTIHNPGDGAVVLTDANQLETILRQGFQFNVLQDTGVNMSPHLVHKLDAALVNVAASALSFLSYLRKSAEPTQLAQAQAEMIRVKNSNYGGSWCKRGGVGAFFSFIRKVDRIETLFPKYREGQSTTVESSDFKDDDFEDTYADIVGYCLLFIERRAQMYVAQGYEPLSEFMQDVVSHIKLGKDYAIA